MSACTFCLAVFVLKAEIVPEAPYFELKSSLSFHTAVGCSKGSFAVTCRSMFY